MFSTKLVEVNPVAKDTVEFFLSKPEGYTYKAGQHTSVTISKQKGENNDVTHTFSYTSDPLDEAISFMTRLRDSEFKKALLNSNIGDTFELSAPSGFAIGEGIRDVDNFLYIAAGVGITPLMGYLRSMDKSMPPVKLLWVNQTIETTPYYQEFVSDIFSEDGNLDLDLFLTREESEGKFKKGRLNIAVISTLIEETVPERIYIVGAPSFVEDMWSLVLSTGFSDEKITTENFGGY